MQELYDVVKGLELPMAVTDRSSLLQILALQLTDMIIVNLAYKKYNFLDVVPISAFGTLIRACRSELKILSWLSTPNPSPLQPHPLQPSSTTNPDPQTRAHAEQPFTNRNIYMRMNPRLNTTEYRTTTWEISNPTSLASAGTMRREEHERR